MGELLWYVNYISVKLFLKYMTPGNSLAVQWLGLSADCLGPGSIPGRGTKIPQASQRGQKKKDTNELI